jgi:outer membrane protein assembly factor BamB
MLDAVLDLVAQRLDRCTMRLVFTLWFALVVIAIMVAYPRLFASGPRAAPFARPSHPVARMPIHTAAYRALASSSPVSFAYRGDPSHRGLAAGPLDPGRLVLAYEHGHENVGIHDASKSSPAVDASGVYVGFDTGRLVAFDHAGTKRWQFVVAHSARGIHATAALDDTRLYIGAYNGTLYALDKQTGTPLWVLRLGDTLGASPAIVGEDLYVSVETFSPPDGFVAKVDRRTGEVRWLSDWLGEQAHSTPTIDPARGLVYVGANNGIVRAFAIADGRERWRFDAKGAVKGTLALADGALYFATMSSSLWALDAATGVPRWQQRLGGRSRSSATLIDELGLVALGADDGSFSTFDARTGTPRWSIGTGQRPYPASATAVQDSAKQWQLVTPCASHTMCVLDAATGAVLRRFELGADVTGAATVYAGSIYLSADRGGGLTRFQPR